MHKYVIVFALFYASVALSDQKPLNEGTQQSNNKDVNGTSDTMAPKDNGERTFGLLKPAQVPIQYAYRPQWQYVNPAAIPQFRNEEIMDSARTLGHLKPQLYSQYQAWPQSYALPTYQTAAYDYSTPYALSGYSHYPSYGYSGYSPYYKNAEDDKYRQIMSVSPAISTLNPSVPFASKYMVDKPVSAGFSNMQGYYQSQSSSQSMMQPMWIRNMHEGEIHQLRDAAEDKVATFVNQPLTFARNDLSVNDRLQNYMLNPIQQFTPAENAQQSFYAQPQFSRAAEEAQPMAWSLPRAVPNQPLQDAYITPNDQVIMEPMPESSYAQRAAAQKPAPQEQVAIYPNWDQQMKMGEMQYYYNTMNEAATQAENLAQDFANKKDLMQQGPAARSTENTTKTLSKNQAQVLLQLQTLLENLKSTIPQTDVDKFENKIDQDAVPKSNDSNVGAAKKIN